MNDESKTTDRRQDEDGAIDVPKDQKVYILLEGQKSGPYSKQEVLEKLSSKEVLVTDPISINGYDWFHLHKWSEFDRRSASADELPGVPKVNLFQSSDQEVKENLSSETNDHIEKDVIAGLAYLGHLKSGKKSQYHSDKYEEPNNSDATPMEIPDLEPLTFESKKIGRDTYLWGAVLSFALVGIFYLFSSDPKLQKTAGTAAESSSETSASKTEKAIPPRIIKRNSLGQNSKKQNNKVFKARKRTPSFAKSKAFVNRAPRINADTRIKKPVVEDPDDYYYDDGSDPVELDPIRSKVAKETFDPEDEKLDEYLDNVDAAREPASTEEITEDPEKAFEALYE